MHDGGVLQRPGLLKGAAHLCDGGSLLPDRHIDATNLLRGVSGLPVGFLVDDRVDRDGGLSGFAVTDDQLALSPADRSHRVDGLDACLQRLTDLLAVHDTRSLQFQSPAALDAGDFTKPIDGIAHGIDNAPKVAVADRHGEHLACSMHGRTLIDAFGVSQHNSANLALVEVEGNAHGAVLKAQQLIRHRRG